MGREREEESELFTRFFTNDTRDSSPGFTLASFSFSILLNESSRGIRNVAMLVFECYLIRNRKGRSRIALPRKYISQFPRANSRAVLVKQSSPESLRHLYPMGICSTESILLRGKCISASNRIVEKSWIFFISLMSISANVD